MTRLEIVSKLNHLAAILHPYAGGLSQKEKGNTFNNSYWK